MGLFSPIVEEQISNSLTSTQTTLISLFDEFIKAWYNAKFFCFRDILLLDKELMNPIYYPFRYVGIMDYWRKFGEN